jgi:single-strand DNA-binding protein
MGNLTREPELRHTPKGTAVCKVGLAVNRAWRNEAGELKEKVTFVDIAVFGKTAENVAHYLHKGSPVFVEGRLELESWIDRESQEKRSKLSVVAELVQFLNSGKRENADAPIPTTPGHRPVERGDLPGPDAGKPLNQSGDDTTPPEDDDVPF